MLTLPIRVREIIRPDGTRGRSLLVFCPREDASIAPDRCARCGFRCPPEDEGFAPAVGCGASPLGEAEGPVDGLLLGKGAAAARVAAGAASAQIIVCLQAAVPLSVASGMVNSKRWIALPVVDDDGLLLGCVPSTSLTSDDARAPFVTVEEVMVPVFAVRESDHLDEVIGTMTSHHLRHVSIVNGAGHVTGVLSDLDLLRWVARGAPVRWR